MRSLNGLVVRSLVAHRLRSLLTVVAIATGVAMILAAAVVGQAASRQAAQVAGEGRVNLEAAPVGGEPPVHGQPRETMGNVLLVQAGLAAVGLIILFAAGFVILNAFAMSVTGRLRELGTLRALGMRRGLGRDGVARLVLAEAGLLGLAGTTAGLLAGPALAWCLMQATGTLQDARLVVPSWGIAAGVALGLGVTLAAALQPAWRAGRVAPIVLARPEADGVGWYETRAPRLGAWLLALSMVGMAAFGLLGRPTAFVAQAAMMVGQGLLLAAAGLLLPGLVAPLAVLLRPLMEHRLGTAGRLAADNLIRNRSRAALTAAALAAGLTVMVASSGLMTAGLKGGITRISTAVREDVFVAGDLEGMVAARQMTVDNFLQFIAADQPGYDLNAVLDALHPLVAAGHLSITRYRFLPIPAELSAIPGAPGLFVDPGPYLRSGNFDFFQGDPEVAIRLMERGQAVLLLPIAAERLGVGAGDQVTLTTPRGDMHLTVAGIGGGAFMMPILSYADAVAWYGVTAPSFLGLFVLGEGPVLAKVQATVESLPGVKLLDLGASVEPVVRMVDRLELLIDGLLLLAVMVAALGVVNTMAINVAERRRELGLLRAVGATRRQVQQAIVAEAAVLGLLAAIVAAGLGLLMLLSWGLLVLPYGTASVGVRPDWDTVRQTVGAGLVDWARAAAVALLFAPLVAGLAAALPARHAAAKAVVQAVRGE